MSATDSTKFLCRFNETNDFHSKLFEFYKEQEYCDVFFQTADGQKIAAHRIVLAAANKYLEEKTANFMNLSLIDKLPAVSGDILSFIVEYCYTGKIDIGEENVAQFYAAAGILGFYEIQRRCCKYYYENITSRNCLKIWRVARQFKIHSLQLYAVGFICSRFVEVINTTDFLKMELYPLSVILKYDEIQVRYEEDVFTAIENWIRKDIEKRAFKFVNLFRFVNAPKLDPKFIRSRVRELCKEINEDIAFMDICYNHVVKNPSDRVMSMESYQFVNPIGVSKPDDNDEDLICFWKYKCMPSSWEQIGEPLRISYDRIFILDSKVVFEKGGQLTIYNLITFETTMGPSFNKQYYSAAVFADSIYLIGGVDDSTVLRYNDLIEELTPIASMSVPRMSACSTVLSGYIYVMGGRNDGEVLHSAECYNPFLNEWTSIASMTADVLPIDATAFDGYIYVLDSQLKDKVTVYRYDVKANFWSKMYTLSDIGPVMGISHYETGLIFVIGTHYITELLTVEFDSQDRESILVTVENMIISDFVRISALDKSEFASDES